MSDLLIGKSLVFSKIDTPTREGEVVETVEDIKNIPTPREGMIVYVRGEKKNYIVLSLKDKVVGGETIPNAQVDEYEELDAAVRRMIDVLNGTGEGSVDKKIKDAIAVLIDGAPEMLDSFAEIVAWIEEHGKEAAEIIAGLNDTRNKGVLFGSFGVQQTDESQVKINYLDINQKFEGVLGIPAATTEKAGVMSAEDKNMLSFLTERIQVMTEAEYEALTEKKEDVFYFIIEET